MKKTMTASRSTPDCSQVDPLALAAEIEEKGWLELHLPNDLNDYGRRVTRAEIAVIVAALRTQSERKLFTAEGAAELDAIEANTPPHVEALAQWVEKVADAPEDSKAAVANAIRAAERTILDRCHHALGESEHSDDESLPDSIALHIRERDQRIAELEASLAQSAKEAISHEESTLPTHWLQVGWAKLGTVHGQRYIQGLRNLEEGQNDYYHHAVYVLETYAPHATVGPTARDDG